MYIFICKAIPVVSSGDLQGREMLMISHCLDSRLTDGSEVVSLTHRPPFTPDELFYLCL
jgi:hypothetical protein